MKSNVLLVFIFFLCLNTICAQIYFDEVDREDLESSYDGLSFLQEIQFESENARFFSLSEFSLENPNFVVSLPTIMNSQVRFSTETIALQPNDGFKWIGRSANNDYSLVLKRGDVGLGGILYDNIKAKKFLIFPMEQNLCALIEINAGADVPCQQAMIEPETGPTEMTNNNGCQENPPPPNMYCDDICPGNIHMLFLVPFASATWTIGEGYASMYFDLLTMELEMVWINSKIDGNSITYAIETFQLVVNNDDSPISDCFGATEELSEDNYVQNLRNQHNADIVVYFDEPKESYTSVGACAHPDVAVDDESTAYCMMPINRAIQSYVFVHELGHIFGASHWEPDGAAGVDTDCAFEYQFTSKTGNKYATVLVSNFQQQNSVTHKLPYYSSPYNQHGSWCLGENDYENTDYDTDNAGHIREVSCIVSNYRVNENEISVNIIPVENQNCLLTLNSLVTPDQPNCNQNQYEYEWRYNLVGYFHGNYQSTLLSTAQDLVVMEPISDPCVNYFVELSVYASQCSSIPLGRKVIRVEGGICTENPLPCDHDDDVSAFVGDDNQVQVMENLNFSQTSSKSQKSQTLFDLNGNKVYQFYQISELENAGLVPGMYFYISYVDGKPVAKKLIVSQ